MSGLSQVRLASVENRMGLDQYSNSQSGWPSGVAMSALQIAKSGWLGAAARKAPAARSEAWVMVSW